MSGKPAARLGDPTACPLPGHGTNPIAAGSPDVLLDGLPAARQGDPSACGGAMAGNVILNVLINGMPAATVGTVGSHGNVVVSGSGTVVIGMAHSPAPFIAPLALAFHAFDLFVQVLDKASGAPMPNIPYVATLADGTQVRGVTDESGRSQLLGKQDRPQNILFSIKPRWIARGE